VVDLSEYLPSDYSDDFAPAFWNAISYEGAPYGFPHHTDTFALFYNTDYFETLGIEPPGSLDQAWKWDEFIDVARRINEETEAQYAFAYNWQGLSAYRWMPILYQNGGQLLSDDLKSPQVNTPEGIEAIAWPQSWFEEELVPPNTAVKSEEEIENVFRTGTIGMMLTGDWLVPYLDENMKNYGWDVTYMPRNVEAASDLGGNGLLITKDSQNPDIAADFLQFISSPENMEFFCTNFTFIPTRKSLLEKNLDYKIRPEDMQLFFEQSATIPDQMAREQAIPAFSKINQSLADQLDLAFTSGQSPEKTAQNIEADIKEALSEQE
jgi:multiple sugar transport system substrate-binding protein